MHPEISTIARRGPYAPQLGIFAQPDPIRYVGDGPNLYAYVLDDPVNSADPLGLNETVQDSSCYLGETYICTGQIPVTGQRGPTADQIDFVNQFFWNIFREGTSQGGAGGFPTATDVRTHSPAKPEPSRWFCATQSGMKNGVSLFLDAAAIGADVALSPELGAVAALGLGVVAIGNSIASDQVSIRALAGIGIAYTGRHASVAAGLFHGPPRLAAEKFARKMLAISAAFDIANSITDYNNCMNGMAQ